MESYKTQVFGFAHSWIQLMEPYRIDHHLTLFLFFNAAEFYVDLAISYFSNEPDVNFCLLKSVSI